MPSFTKVFVLWSNVRFYNKYKIRSLFWFTVKNRAVSDILLKKLILEIIKKEEDKHNYCIRLDYKNNVVLSKM
jgi:hypothetical protein